MKTTGYTTSYAVYYTFGSVWSGGLSADTLPKLKKVMEEFALKQNEHDNVEIVTFQPPTKVVSTRGERGFFVQFHKKITNRYFGQSKPTKYYDKL